MHRNPFEISSEAEIVKVLRRNVKKIRGSSPDLIGHSWWEDSALFAEAGIDTVIIGPQGGGIHTHTEWVDTQSVLDLTRIFIETIIDYCG
jgi:acetylornithine deacetylase